MTQASTGDRKSVREAEKAAIATERARAEVVRTLMSTPAGREFVWNILGECSVFSTTFTGDPLTSAYNEGRRSTGLALLATVLLACPDMYLQAQRESNGRSTADEHTRRPHHRRDDLGSGIADPAEDGDDDPDDGDEYSGPFFDQTAH